MSQLGKFQKQPVEVEKYAIQYVQALTATDELENFTVVLSNGKQTQRVVATTPYSVSGDVTSLVVLAKSAVTLPATATEGATVFIANTNATASLPITYGAAVHILLATCAVQFIYRGASWKVATEVVGNLINIPGDQRVRFIVSGGVDSTTYTVENTVYTQEGRVLQDEFQLKIKEL